MTNDDESILKKVRKLGDRVRRSMAKSHLPNPQQKAAVHQIVEAQWRREQLTGKAQITAEQRAEAQRQQMDKAQEASKQTTLTKKAQNQSQSKDKGQSH